MSTRRIRTSARIRHLATIAFLGVPLVGCSGSKDSPSAPSVDAVSITLNVTSLRLLVGDSYVLEASARSSDGAAVAGTIRWSTSDPSVVSVEATGRIEASSAGQATITASSGAVSARATVTVPSPAGQVSAAGGQVETPDGKVQLAVPENALSDAVDISIETALADSIPQGTELVGGTAFEFGPAGLSFARAATLSVAYDPALLSGSEELRLRLHKLVDEAWVPVDGSTVDTASTAVAGEITSFSIYGILPIPNEAPTARITSPEDGSAHDLASVIDLAGEAVDPEEGELQGDRLSWSSDVDGALGTGAELSTSALSLGTHVLTLTAKDSDGAEGKASVSIIVSDPPPSALITAPEDGAVVKVGSEVTFQGSGSDPIDGALPGSSLSWTSSVDGVLGTGETLTTSSLTEGAHVITLMATNGRGGTAVDSISLTVAPNAVPLVTIEGPHDDADFDEGDVVAFSGSAQDEEDGSLTGAALVWSSDRDGILGSGSYLRSGSLSRGRHTITLTATDSDGGVGQASVEIRVYGVPAVQIGAPANDATVSAGVSIDFVGSATDPEDGILSGSSLVWTSDADGQIGLGEAFSTASLSAGAHRITLTATDSDGRSRAAGIGVDVLPLAPDLVSPAAGAVLDNGCSDFSDPIVRDFEWTSVPGADMYHLYVKGKNAISPVIDADVAGTSYHDEVAAYVIESNRFGWTWKVRAKARGVWGPWSESRLFDVEPLNTDCGGG
jgi:hypothetical protein